MGHIAVPPPGFGVGQLMVLLSSCLIVAATLTARKLWARVASLAALTISVLLVVLEAWYHRLYVHGPIGMGYGYYVGVSVTGLAAVLSVLAVVVAFTARRR